MIKIFLIVIIYGIIGIFITGFTNDDEDNGSWTVYCIIFWPILFFIFWFYLIFHKFYFLGKNLNNYIKNKSSQKIEKIKKKKDTF